MIRDGFFTPGSEGEFSDLVNMLLHHDRFLTLADYKVSSEKAGSKYFPFLMCRPTSAARTWCPRCTGTRRAGQRWQSTTLPAAVRTVMIDDDNDSDEMTIMMMMIAGKFSSDRTIAEYAREIWGMEPR